MVNNVTPYNRFHLVREMYETVSFIKNSTYPYIDRLVSGFTGNTPVMLTGEGSSRIFPAKNAVHNRLISGRGPLVLTESSTDLAGKNLDDFIVIGASNSGKTKELVNLFRNLKNSGHRHLYGLSCNPNSLLEKYSEKAFVIDIGIEKAVAASKSVVAQALFYDTLLLGWNKKEGIDTNRLSVLFEQALNIEMDNAVTDKICKAGTVYFTGNNNGVAEELALKTNEIIRKKSAFLPGTYLLHGIEEVITADDIIIMVDAYPDEYEKIKSVYSNAIGTPVIAFSNETSPFPTVIIPPVHALYEPNIKLAAGWNLLVEAGIKSGIDIDKPQRARKIGNEAYL